MLSIARKILVVTGNSMSNVVQVLVLTFIELLHFTQSLQCPQLSTFGVKIADNIHKAFEERNISCHHNKNCSKLDCVDRGEKASLLKFSLHIDYCSPAVTVAVNGAISSKNNVTLHNNSTRELKLMKGWSVSFTSKLLMNKTSLDINTTVRVTHAWGLGSVIYNLLFQGLIKNKCRNTTVQTITTLTTHTNATTHTSNTSKTINSTSTTIKPTTKSIKPTSETKSVTKSTKSVTKSTKSVTKPTKSVTKSTKSVTKPTKPVTKSTKPVTKETKPVTKETIPPTKITKKPIKTTNHAILTLKPTQSKYYHSKTTKAVLLTLAIIILIVVTGLVIYCRKKKRLSNLPAYYNDIVINDPLKLEIHSDTDNADGDINDDDDDDDDDDELPLFS